MTMERALAAVQKGRKRLAAFDPVDVLAPGPELPPAPGLFDQDA
jgi:hypothetical protein